ncbi:hypothetical protein KY285_005881 [Solanum tuberosum]|nr:hypothetical protein KY285_005881 [Solanum tuberosum]
MKDVQPVTPRKGEKRRRLDVRMIGVVARRFATRFPGLPGFSRDEDYWGSENWAQIWIWKLKKWAVECITIGLGIERKWEWAGYRVAENCWASGNFKEGPKWSLKRVR